MGWYYYRVIAEWLALHDGFKDKKQSWNFLETTSGTAVLQLKRLNFYFLLLNDVEINCVPLDNVNSEKNCLCSPSSIGGYKNPNPLMH